MEITSANAYVCYFIYIFSTNFYYVQVLKVVKYFDRMRYNAFCDWFYCGWREMKSLIIKVLIPLNNKRPVFSLWHYIIIYLFISVTGVCLTTSPPKFIDHIPPKWSGSFSKWIQIYFFQFIFFFFFFFSIIYLHCIENPCSVKNLKTLPSTKFMFVF